MGLDLSLGRILLLVCWLRILLRNEHRGFQRHPIDLALLAWCTWTTVAYTTLHGTTGALVYKLGEAFDAVGLYFFFRIQIVSLRELDGVARALTILALLSLVPFLVERATGKNAFAALGGIPWLTEEREGKLRCQAAFSHPILAGSFWATAAPLILASYWALGSRRFAAVLGSLCAAVIVWLSASSTPFVAYLVGILAGLAYFGRRYLRIVGVCSISALLLLQLAMKGPFWGLIARVDLVGGSTGWHRFFLIDQAIHHFPEWWLLGTTDTRHWGQGLQDLTNQFVRECVHGGVLELALFLVLIVLGFRAALRASKRFWPVRRAIALSWACGVSLLIQCVAFLGVSYFGQSWTIWYTVLACLACSELVSSRMRTADIRACSVRWSPSGTGAMVLQPARPRA
jgi:hypothetical protein